MNNKQNWDAGVARIKPQNRLGANSITPERKLRYLSEYMSHYIDLMPNKAKRFDDWLNSRLDKSANNGIKSHRKQLRSICRYCGVPFDDYVVEKTKDHIIPISKGGLDRNENRTPCCFDCNQWKTDKMPKEWLNELVSLIKNDRKILPPYNRKTVEKMVGSLRVVIKYLEANKKLVSLYNF